MTPEPSATRPDLEELETFIIIHDQRLLLEYERQARFSDIHRLRYLFVGPGATDLLGDRDNVVVARHLPDNIEHYPYLLSFTGWYAIARNQLASTSHVAILEHDVTIFAQFEHETLAAMRDTHSIVGYLALGLAHPFYLHATPWLARSLEEAHGIDVPGLIRDYLRQGGADQWTTTTSHAMRSDDLAAFVDWFLPVTEVFRHDPMGSLVHERAVPVFCLLNHIDDRYASGVLAHAQVVSHGIDSPSYDEVRRRAEYHESLISPVALYERVLGAEQAVAEQSRRAEAAEQAVAEQSRRAEAAEQLCESVLNSSSWRLMAPMRRVGRILRRSRARLPER